MFTFPTHSMPMSTLLNTQFSRKVYHSRRIKPDHEENQSTSEYSMDHLVPRLHCIHVIPQRLCTAFSGLPCTVKAWLIT